MDIKKKTISTTSYWTLALLSLLMLPLSIAGQSAHVAYDAGAKVFRLDGGSMSYVFGVNARGELQQIYWGGRLGDTDTIPQPRPMREAASFDSSYTTTPEEYAGWGAGRFTEPALKVTFADGNRDLVLHYVSESPTPDGFDVRLKDISRELFVTLHYRIDSATGIIARSAT